MNAAGDSQRGDDDVGGGDVGADVGNGAEDANSGDGGELLHGGLQRLKAGDIVTVPLSVSPSNGAFRVILRFKRCGSTVQRFVGTLNVDSRIEALKQRWGLIREPKIVESNGWSWVTASP